MGGCWWFLEEGGWEKKGKKGEPKVNGLSHARSKPLVVGPLMFSLVPGGFSASKKRLLKLVNKCVRRKGKIYTSGGVINLKLTEELGKDGHQEGDLCRIGR
jgi:hypothetical protein